MQDVEIRRVIIGILPNTSLETGASMAILACIDMLSKRESTQGAVAILKETKVQGCVSKNSDPKKRKAGQTRLNASARHAIKFSGHVWYEVQIREKRAISRRYPKKVNLMSEILARRSLRKEHLRKPHDKKSKPAKKHGFLARKILKLKTPRTRLRSILLLNIKAPDLVSQNTEECVFAVDSGASMHMLSKKDLSSDEVGTLRRSRNPSTVVTADGEVQTNEEAQVCVHNLDLFVTVQLLETPAVHSLGKLCEDHGYSYEWVGGQKPRLTRDGKTITCVMDNCVPLVVPRLSSSSSSSSTSTSRPKDQSKFSGESEASTDPLTTRRAKHAW